MRLLLLSIFIASLLTGLVAFVNFTREGSAAFSNGPWALYRLLRCHRYCRGCGNPSVATVWGEVARRDWRLILRSSKIKGNGVLVHGST